MTHLKSNKKNNTRIKSAAITLPTIMILLSSTILLLQIPAQAILVGTSNTGRDVSVIVSGDNIYTAWWTNATTVNGNEEVMFKASNNGGETFGDGINLSNSPRADSWRVKLAAEGANVIVSWWESHQTRDTPVARISTDGGQTFGPMLRLAADVTMTNTDNETLTTAENTTTITSPPGGE
jgi:hypothetical protein